MTAPAWHAEARELRRTGLTIRAIAAHFRKHPKTVRDLLDENNHRVRSRQNPPRLKHRPHTEVIEKRPTRVVRRVLVDPASRLIAAAAFARGEIDLAELMRRITA